MKTPNYTTDPDHFYETPAECTVALMNAEGQFLPLEVWEPCCGKGAIIQQMPGRNWHASDLVDRGWGKAHVDFLMERHRWADAIITNPPFKLLGDFIHKAFDLEVSYVAMFHRITFLCTTSWQVIYERQKPARIYNLTWRPDMFGIGTPDQRCL